MTNKQKEKQWLQPSTDDNRTDYLEVNPNKTSDLVAMIDTMLTIAKIVSEDLRWIHDQHVSIEETDIMNALLDFCTHKDVIYLAGYPEGSKIAPRSEDDKRIMDSINKAYDKLVEKGVINK